MVRRPLGELTRRFAFPAADLERYSARWYSYLRPPADHALVGEGVRAFWRERSIADGLLEQQLTLGLGLVVLSGVALAAWRRRRSAAPAGRAVPMLAALGGAAWLGSLAPGLPAMLHPVLPMFRAHARLGIVVQLAVALLAAAGLVALVRRGRWGRRAAVALVALAVAELAPLPP